MKPKLQLLLGLACLVLGLYTFKYPSWRQCSWDEEDGVRLLLFGDPQIRGTAKNTDLRTRVDIFGNDYFLGHIYKTMLKLKPTKVVVLGDLFSSQWIDDAEFANRARRFKSRIFTGDVWTVSGNHDIGYAHEVTAGRVARFEKDFGALNFAVYEEGVRLIVFNSMSVDGLVEDGEAGQFTAEVRSFLSDQMAVEYSGLTILITHVPLYKPAGVCVDSPYFTYYEEGQIREQNTLSLEASRWLLDGLFRDGLGIIVNGHDHEGCLVRHVYRDEWQVEGISKGRQNYDYVGTAAEILEITVRSMMGEFGGNSGLLSVSGGNSTVHFKLCAFGPQQLWWATYGLFFLFAVAALV